jgi:hypothetical protein
LLLALKRVEWVILLAAAVVEQLQQTAQTQALVALVVLAIVVFTLGKRKMKCVS